jgi:hypothetical protein
VIVVEDPIRTPATIRGLLASVDFRTAIPDGDIWVGIVPNDCTCRPDKPCRADLQQYLQLVAGQSLPRLLLVNPDGTVMLSTRLPAEKNTILRILKTHKE